VARSLILVGSEFPCDLVENVSFYSSQSLLDADVVLFEPPSRPTSYQSYQGKARLDESDSFQFKEACTHWRGEISECLGAGKTVIVFLKPFQDFFIDTGERSYSGTGRNQKTTTHVALFDNYRFLPAYPAGITPKSGHAIVASGDPMPIGDFWRAFGSDLNYYLYFEDPDIKPLLHTKTGKKTIAGIRDFGGKLILIPPVDWDLDEFVEGHDDGKMYWTDEAATFGKKLLGVLLGIDVAARGGREDTPPPEWSLSDRYALRAERSARAEITRIAEEIESLREQSAAKRDEAQEASRLKALLYGTGKELEAAIVLALQALGFEARNFVEGDSEFDVVFESSEGRCLGEAEGKDNKAINIDKLRQLEMNLQEDFARDDVDEYAAGVLFGNAYRLTNPDERPAEFFTEKCLKAAARSGTVLVRTPDLFDAARYVIEHANTKTYSKRVRKAMLGSGGDVASIPAPPDAAVEQAHRADAVS